MTEAKGVDISEFTKEEESGESENTNKPQTLDEALAENNLNHQELIEELGKEDPVLAMITAQIFDMGNVVGALVNRLDRLERHVGYLLSNDKGVQDKMAEAKKEADVPATDQP